VEAANKVVCKCGCDRFVITGMTLRCVNCNTTYLIEPHFEGIVIEMENDKIRAHPKAVSWSIAER